MNQVIKQGFIPARRMNMRDPLEVAIAGIFGNRMRHDESMCEDIWSAFTMTVWHHQVHGKRNFSIVAVGDMIAAILQTGNFIQWHGCGRTGLVSDEIRDEMAGAGWIFQYRR